MTGAPGPVLNDIDRRELFLSVLWSFQGTLYRWGGDDPSGVDCSGLMVEGLHAVGAIGMSVDLAANSIFTGFQKFYRAEPVRGAMAFWRRPGGKRMIHVEGCLDAHYSIGARGGGSATTDVDAAVIANAFVKVSPIFGRSAELAGFIDLFTHPDAQFPLLEVRP